VTTADLPTKINRGPLIGEGGEGRIYAVEGHPHLVVKAYHKPLSQKKAAKIQTMIERTPARVEAFAAWPLKLMKDRQGAPSAIVMPKIEAAKDIHLLYSPKARRRHFPRADWTFLIQTAQNLSGAFANVHTIGCVIGDVNHGSVLVKENAQVALIDCDSFQVKAGPDLFECEVAVPTFTPPELQEQDLSGRERTANHDAFGLAVLIFHLLFMGRHPFAGRPLSKSDVSIEQAIKEFRFAFSSERARVQLDPPPHTLQLASASPEIAGLFERAFGRAAQRPQPTEWHKALGTLRAGLARCGKEASHAFYKTLPKCPWCEIEAASGAILFFSPHRVHAPPPVQRDELGIGSIEALWRVIAAIPKPLPIASPNASTLAPARPASAEARKIGSFAATVSRIAYGASAIAGVASAIAAPNQPMVWAVGAVGGFWALKLSLSVVNNGKVNALALAHQAASTRWQGICARWRAEADGTAFERAFEQCARLRQEHDRLAEPVRRKVQQRASNRAAAMQRWTAAISRQATGIRERAMNAKPVIMPFTDAELCASFDAQLAAHLDRFSLDKADIPDIRGSRKVKLASFGIETAGDISQHKVQSVPGFGPTLTRRLTDWRKEIERRFVFNEIQARADLNSGKVAPSQPPVAPPPISVDPGLKSRLAQIEAELAAAPPRLQQLATTITSRQEALLSEARATAAELAQAEADARAAKVVR
jgi:DNA-binding helix-hairpin-helix protein with protein kinase domain